MIDLDKFWVQNGRFGQFFVSFFFHQIFFLKILFFFSKKNKKKFLEIFLLNHIQIFLQFPLNAPQKIFGMEYVVQSKSIYSWRQTNENPEIMTYRNFKSFDQSEGWKKVNLTNLYDFPKGASFLRSRFSYKLRWIGSISRISNPRV
jgi:hypothetical protein